MSITRWDPFGDGDMVCLRDAMGRLVNEHVVRPVGGAPAVMAVAAGPVLDVRDEGNAFVVTASVPGVDPDAAEITVLGDSLRIRGERRVGGSERAGRLPTSVQASDTQAEFKDGILTVTLPKAETAREHRIPVRAASGNSGGQRQEIPIEAGPPEGEARTEGTAANAGS